MRAPRTLLWLLFCWLPLTAAAAPPAVLEGVVSPAWAVRGVSRVPLAPGADLLPGDEILTSPLTFSTDVAPMVRAGLTRANRGEIEVAKAIEESILENTPHISARIQWLWSLANVATLFGLIGTIVGLIGTFKSLGNVPADQKQAMLSKGISEAMNNTAFGLAIAVSCIVAHLFLTAYAKRMIETVELNAMKLENLLGRRNALRVLWELRGEPLTFRALQAAAETNPSLLNTRLKELRAAGWVEHEGDGYGLTPLGRDLLQALQPLAEWAGRWGS